MVKFQNQPPKCEINACKHASHFICVQLDDKKTLKISGTVPKSKFSIVLFLVLLNLDNLGWGGSGKAIDTSTKSFSNLGLGLPGELPTCLQGNGI